MKPASLFYQLFDLESSTYTYLIADPISKEATIIDCVLEMADRDHKLIQELGFKLKYILETHIHADHITGSYELKKRTGALSAVSVHSGVECADLLLKDGDVLMMGELKITALATPGHTHSCMSFFCDGRVFTGDSLMIRGAGRTDFQQGSAETLYESVHQKLFCLEGSTQVYPGHDYRGQTSSTIEIEKQYNPRLGLDKSKSDFVKIMSDLKLDQPKKINVSVPANLKCGRV